MSVTYNKLNEKTKINFILKVLFASLIFVIFAKIYIPLPFVPITGQTLGLMLVGLSFDKKIGVSSVIVYLFYGIIGLPVFSEGAFGISVIFGSSGGYLIGFIPASYLLGYLVEKGYLKSFGKSALAIFAGDIIVFTFGLLQLSFFVPFNKLFVYGLYPFLIGEIIKCLLTIFIAPRCHEFFKK